MTDTEIEEIKMIAKFDDWYQKEDGSKKRI